MKKVDICHFSGTGNTLLVVKAIVEELEKQNIEVRLHPMETTDPKSLIVEDTLGLAFPVAVQSTYGFVWKFVRSLPYSDGKKAFMVDTLAMSSGGIVGPLKDTMRKKGYRTAGAIEILMPDNIFQMKEARDKNLISIEKGIAQAQQFAQQLVSESATWKKNWIFGYLMFSLYVFAWAMMSRAFQYVFGKLFFLNLDKKTCSRCNLCSKLCPVNNIVRSAAPRNKPMIGKKCEFCMRCIAFCPKNAIYFGCRRTAKYHYHAVTSSEILRYYRKKST